MFGALEVNDVSGHLRLIAITHVRIAPSRQHFVIHVASGSRHFALGEMDAASAAASLVLPLGSALFDGAALAEANAQTIIIAGVI